MNLDLYFPTGSWLHRLDPRVKLWATLLGAGVPFVLPLPGLLLFLLLLHALLRSAGIPWPRLGWIWKQMQFVLVLILILQPLFVPAGPALIGWGPLTLTWGGLENGVQLALRAITLALVTGGLLLTTDQRELILAFVRLGLPYSWGLTLSLTLRFLPAVAGLFEAVREAQAARGWVAEGNPLRRARDYLPVLVAVIIGTLRISDELTLALAARGLGATPRRTVWRDLAMRPVDWLAALAVTLAFGILLMLR